MATFELNELQARLGYRFRDEGLLRCALTHRSSGATHNERLEFLGDAVLEMIVSESLYRRFTALSEGDLTRMRSTLVRGQTLAALARRFRLDAHIRLGAGERASGGRRRDSTLADAVEAIIAAIYLDAGLDAARACVLAWLGERMATLDDAESLKDPKTRLQEMLQADQQALPEYRVESMDGPEHQRRFTVSCRVAGWAQAFVGSGVSRRKAEQAAALLALQALDGQHGS